jgi:hypothetical protein
MAQMRLLLPHSCHWRIPFTRMADITAEAAAKRPFDEHRHAVLTLRVFCLEDRGRSVAAREPETFRRPKRLIGGAILTVWPILVPGTSYYIAPVPLFLLTYRFPIGRVVRYPDGRVGGVVVIEAPDLLHARFRAELAGADRELEFASGHQLDPESARQVPADMLGRRLNRGDLRMLDQMLVRKKPPAPSVRQRRATKRRVGKP